MPEAHLHNLVDELGVALRTEIQLPVLKQDPDGRAAVADERGHLVGDLITAAMGAYIVWEGRNLGMSKFQLARMTANVGIDTALGAIPFVGDAFDFIWRSNSKNLRIIKRHLDKHHPGTRTINV